MSSTPAERVCPKQASSFTQFKQSNLTLLNYDSEEKALGLTFVSEDELLARSDILSLHCPLTSATRRWLNAERIAKMKNGAYIVNVSAFSSYVSSPISPIARLLYPSGPAHPSRLRNSPSPVQTARGDIIDESSLKSALESRKLNHAGLDVFVGEPNPDPWFTKSPYVTVQPHFGAFTKVRGSVFVLGLKGLFGVGRNACGSKRYREWRAR